MKDTLSAPQSNRGAILDGVVRTVPQAEGLNKMLGDLHRPLNAVLLFDIPEDELVRRLSDRVVCEGCQTPYMGRNPGETCEKCGGKLVRRKDDEPEAVRNRLVAYKKQTAPVIDWYRINGVAVHTINAVGTVDEVHQRVLRALGR